MDLTDEKLQGLLVLAKNTLTSSSRKRPLFVEFAGTPKSGKSTCIDTVNHFFRRLDYRVLAPTEGASKRTPYYLKSDLVAFNVWSATYALTHILEGRYGSDKYDLVIMDRGLFDALAWFELLTQREDITKEVCSAIQSFLLVDHWRELVDIVFLFQTDPDTSLERENQHKLIDEPGITMNPDFLRDLNEAYSATRLSYENNFNNLQVIDTGKDSQVSQKLAAFKVAELIVEHLHDE